MQFSASSFYHLHTNKAQICAIKQFNAKDSAACENVAQKVIFKKIKKKKNRRNAGTFLPLIICTSFVMSSLFLPSGGSVLMLCREPACFSCFHFVCFLHAAQNYNIWRWVFFFFFFLKFNLFNALEIFGRIWFNPWQTVLLYVALITAKAPKHLSLFDVLRDQRVLLLWLQIPNTLRS